jgi:hypothetical protein
MAVENTGLAVVVSEYLTETNARTIRDTAILQFSLPLNWNFNTLINFVANTAVFCSSFTLDQGHVDRRRVVI